MRRRRLVAALALATLAGGCGSATTTTHSPIPTAARSANAGQSAPVDVNGHADIRGQDFTAGAPRGWLSVRVPTSNPGTAMFFLASKRAQLPQTGIPPKGVIALTVVEVQISAQPATPLPSPALIALGQIASKLVSTPAAATDAKALSGVKSIDLAGTPAIQYATGYTVNGQGNVQEDVVSQSGMYAYLVELDVAPSSRTAGEAALNALLQSWQWQGQTSV